MKSLPPEVVEAYERRFGELGAAPAALRGACLSCIHRDLYIERAESAAEHQTDTKAVHDNDSDALGADAGKALLLASDQTHHENA